ncbi:hypothetical protein [Paenibacillus bovis]|nr:hypothetical protein [Paenibacillus bovis]
MQTSYTEALNQAGKLPESGVDVSLAPTLTGACHFFEGGPHERER